MTLYVRKQNTFEQLDLNINTSEEEIWDFIRGSDPYTGPSAVVHKELMAEGYAAQFLVAVNVADRSGMASDRDSAIMTSETSTIVIERMYTRTSSVIVDIYTANPRNNSLANDNSLMPL